jgi:hypothetical protein
MLVQQKATNVEFAVIESCLPKDDTHKEDDKLKIAKTLKFFLDQTQPKQDGIDFIGIQTQGRLLFC